MNALSGYAECRVFYLKAGGTYNNCCALELKGHINSNKLVNLCSCYVDWWFQKSLEASCFTSCNYLMLFSIGHIIIVCIFVSVCSFILNTLYFTLNLLHIKLISVLFGMSNIVTQIDFMLQTTGSIM
jgi:hypothetical protein